PKVIGEELAGQVHTYSQYKRLGYYPALDFFQGQNIIPEDLLDAARNVAWLAKELVQDEVHRHLHRAFAQIQVQRIHSVAFTLPRVRPLQQNSLMLLGNHYTPNTMRVGMVLTTQGNNQSTVGLEEYAQGMLWQGLNEHFSALKVTSSQLV
ncbi:MAG: hypothetical protein GY731_20565, partial [Gammaproteobacteria bacterium]|nr:hypothetical protein [Gammaproteobacteria bacterium]